MNRFTHLISVGVLLFIGLGVCVSVALMLPVPALAACSSSC